MEEVMSKIDFLWSKWAYLLSLTPVVTDWLEHGRWPATSREMITEVVVGTVIIGIVHLLYRNMHRLKIHADTDGLTNLYNRRKFSQDLEWEVARARRLNNSLALVYLDIDKFKKINDEHGHHCGDAVLVEVAKLLQKSGRQRVDMFYRLGGDEFAVILPGADEQEAQHVIQRKLRNEYQSHNFLQKLRVSFSFGIAGMRTTESPEELLKRADEAMYSNKQGTLCRSLRNERLRSLRDAVHF
jgi:diguanylate cyclase (GGDEF)-like protein